MSKPQPIWQHLPFHFKEDVVSYLDFKSKCSLRICSKGDQKVVDSRPITIDLFGLNLTERPVDDVHKETPAEIVLRDKNVTMSKFFTPHSATEYFMRIFKLDEKFKVNTLNIHVWNYNRHDDHFKFFKKFLERLNSENVRPKIHNFELPTSFMDEKQLESLVRVIDIENLETMSLGGATKFQLENLARLEQWKKVKTLTFETRDQIDPKWVSHVKKLNIRVGKLSPDGISSLLKNFLSNNVPHGSFISISTHYPVVNTRNATLNNIFKKLPFDANNDHIDLATIVDSPIKKLLESPLHTQKIKMRDENFLLVIICESFYGAYVCRDNYFEDDLKSFICG
ncbi:unnamed protein product [Caenorhabditis nigoni]